MPTAPFPVTPELTAITLAYKNGRLIADEALPRVPVGLQEFKFWKYDLATGFTVPDSFVGRKGKPNEVEFKATEQASKTEDYGLDDPVPQADIDNAPANYNPVGRATERVTDLVLLGREKRASDLIFAAGSYASANKIQLASTDQWSAFTTSDPINDITVGLDACVMRPNVMVIGRPAFTKLSQHPSIVKAVLGNSGDKGIATRQQIASLFELEDVLVGEGWVNTAKKGQSASLTRVWGKHAALIFRDKNADSNGGVTFGFTAQWGSRQGGAKEDSNISVRGGQRVRVWESVKELLVANDLGYFIQDAVA